MNPLFRRRFLTLLAASVLVGGMGIAPWSGLAAPANPDQCADRVQAQLRDIEAAAQDRLGVYIVDTGSDQGCGYRSDERFMTLSSFKLLACALVLHRVDTGHESLWEIWDVPQFSCWNWSPGCKKGPGSNT